MTVRALGALVVEGEPQRLDVMVAEIARERTWRPVLRARDAAAALAILDAFVPGLLVLDLETPEVDGSEVLQRVRNDRRYRYSAVIVTAPGEPGEERHDWLPGEIWLPRPFLLDDLDTAIRLGISRLITEFEGRVLANRSPEAIAAGGGGVLHSALPGQGTGR